MNITRGDIFLLDHPYSTGGGSKVRPVLIVQSDRDNARLNSVIFAMITRTVDRASQVATQVLIDIDTPEGARTGLRGTSAVNCTNLFTVHKQLLRRAIGRLPSVAMSDVDFALKSALGIS